MSKPAVTITEVQHNKRAVIWTHEETLKLIVIWRANQESLKKAKRNWKIQIYEKIAKEFQNEHHFNRTTNEVKNKILNLKRDYRFEKQLNSSLPGSKSKYFEIIDQFLGQFPANDDSSTADEANNTGDGESIDICECIIEENDADSGLATTCIDATSTTPSVTISSVYTTANNKKSTTDGHSRPESPASIISNRKRRKSDNELLLEECFSTMHKLVNLQKDAMEKSEDNDRKIIQLLVRQTELQTEQYKMQKEGLEIQKACLEMMRELVRKTH